MISILSRRAALSGLLLGTIGGASLIGAVEHFRWGPAEVFPGVVALLLAPLLFRIPRLATTLRELTAANLVVSSTMTLVLYGYLALVNPAPALPWIGHAGRLAAGLSIAGVVAVACAVIANLYFVAGERGARTYAG